jgi:membrane complex biogenesis BtpA family protein
MKLIGVVHLKSLPGSPSNTLKLDEIISKAQEDYNTLKNGGIFGVVFENFGDTPFVKDDITKRTLVSFTTVLNNIELSKELIHGINVLRNDGIAALSIAEATDADFVRINVLNNTMFTDQGIIEGKANEIMSFKNTLHKKINIYADVFVKHATPAPGSTIENHAEELLDRAGADKIILTGSGTGKEINFDELKLISKIATPDRLVIGSGLNENNVDKIKNYANFSIVGTSLKKEHKVENEVDLNNVKNLVEKAK